MRLRYREGRLADIAANKPVPLTDPEYAWVVFTGSINVFVTRFEGTEPVGPLHFLLQAGAGGGVFGLGVTDQGYGLLARAGVGTQLIRVRRSGLVKLAQQAEFGQRVADLIDGWVISLSAQIPDGLPPRTFTLLGEEPATLGQGCCARPKREVLWASHQQGQSRLAGREDLPVANTELTVPLTNRTWIETIEPAVVQAIDSATALQQDALWRYLDQFHELRRVALNVDAERIGRQQSERLSARAQADGERLQTGFTLLGSVLLSPSAQESADGTDPLLAACQVAGAAQGITIVQPPSRSVVDKPDELREIAQASRIQIRRVALRGEWWKSDSGPMVGYLGEMKRPVALLPASTRGYTIHDPVTHISTPVDDNVAPALDPFAETFYRRLPDRPVSPRDLLRFALVGNGRDLQISLLMALLVGALGLIVPIATGMVFDKIIPSSQRSELLQIAAALVVVALTTTLFDIVRSLATLRAEAKMDQSVQSAVMDRLLSLPATFFRNYSTGDLANRTLSINAMRQSLSSAAAASVFGSVSSLFFLGLLLHYSAKLAVVAFGLIVVFVAFNAVFAMRQTRYQRILMAMGGRLSSVAFQLLIGVAKFRVAGAEQRAFSIWAKEFTEQRRVTYAARRGQNVMAAFQGAYPILTSMAIFATVGLDSAQTTSTGTFLAFNSAFGAFVSAMIGLSSTAIGLFQLAPLYQRAAPILEAKPETDETKGHPGELSGAIDIQQVGFRYGEDGPPVLEDVTVTVKPGEFVALVGPSGSGKSTILRLLLGFEKPESGAVLYDGQDLSGLDVRAVRRQIGSVIQNGRLITGDVLHNIIGASTTLTQDDAWEAAKLAGFDTDIQQMPMGMFTVIGEGGGTLSGGQRQRLLIARALASRPRIVFFDEATSALDNQTQEIVMSSLESMAATRVVIAHRLTTIVKADRIYVLSQGHVVQNGTYDELISEGGLFADLAKRQTV